MLLWCHPALQTVTLQPHKLIPHKTYYRKTKCYTLHAQKFNFPWLAEASAVVMLLSGVVLTYLSFFLGGRGEVADSVLYYMAQCLVLLWK